MTVYIDAECKCHAENAAGRTAVEVPAFDGKCQAWIEGYRFVPSGQTWTREDGEVFTGEMLVPWQNYALLDAAQRAYERTALAEAMDTIAELDEAVIELTYQNIILELEVRE